MKSERFDDVLAYFHLVKDRLDDEDYPKFLSILHDFKFNGLDTAGVTARVKQLLQGHRDLILGFNAFLPEGSKIVVENEPQRPPTKGPIEAINFVNKIKSRLENGVLYERFSEIMNLYRMEGKPITEVCQDVAALFRHHRDLLEEFTQFLPIEHDPQSSDDRSSSDSPMPPTSPLIHEAEKNGHRKRRRDGERLEENVTTATSHKRPTISVNEYFPKPKSVLDPSNVENPSYGYLEKKDRMSSSKRSRLDKEVLNDCWVLAKSSIDGSCRKKNQYEERVFSCEDDQFEMDMLIESVKGAAKHVEKLLEKINELECPIRIEEHFTTTNLRCIRRIYGDSGDEVMDLLRENTTIVLPIILTRLKQKEVEWSACRSEFKKVWAKIYEENIPKSRDHRSCELLEKKALVAEIDENKQCNDDLSISA